MASSAESGDYLADKQAFYHGHQGAGKGELLALALCLPLSIVLTEELKSWLWPPSKNGGRAQRRYICGVLLELVLVVLPQVALFMGGLPPMQLCTTLLLMAACIWAGHATALIPSHHHSPPLPKSNRPSVHASASMPPALTSALNGGGSLVQASKGSAGEWRGVHENAREMQQGNAGECHGHAADMDGEGKRPEDMLRLSPAAVYERLADMAGARRRWVTCFRGGLMLYTVISILAVDFRAFPRRYAKTEMYGTGLMDMGVGAMMVAGGMVSRTTKAPAADRSLLRDLSAGVRAAGPSWLLWILRLVSLRAVDYHEHVGEYGVHWNFFASVAMVSLLSHVVRVPPRWLPALAAVVTCVHQVALSYGSLGAWGLKEKRDMSSLVDMNKEGLVSVLGYWALYLWGASFATASAASLQGPLCQVACNLGLEGGPFSGSSFLSAPSEQASGEVSGKVEPLSPSGEALEKREPLLVSSPSSSPSGEGCSKMAAGAGEADSKAGSSIWHRRVNKEVCGTAGVGSSNCGEGIKGLSHGPINENSSGAGTGDMDGGDRSSRMRGGKATRRPVQLWSAVQPVLGWIGGWALVDLLLWAALTWVEAHIDPVSRRLCNLAFIVWVCAFCGVLLLPMLMAQVLLPTKSCPCLPAAFNRNMLPLFLVANLLTGAVNLSMSTLSVSDPWALVVVSVYATMLCCLAAGLDLWDINIGLSRQKRS